MISGDRKGVNNRHVQFGSITNSGKGYNGHCTFMVSPQEMHGENFDWQKVLCQTFERKDFETFLAGQAVLQMRQISRSRVIASMNY